MGSIRIFLDANILVSGIVFYGNEHELQTKRSRTIVFITSEDVLDETRRTIAKKFPDDTELTDTFLQFLHLTIIKRKRYIHKLQGCTSVRDNKDKHILLASELGKSDYIVSGDDDLLSLKKYKTIPIIRAREALALI